MLLESDIVIVGLQEFVELGTKEVIREKNKKRSKEWQDFFVEQLKL